MTDLEFEILDELYFMTSYEGLSDSLTLAEDDLKRELLLLLKKGWVKILEKDTELEVEDWSSFDKNYKKYNYLATKAGLLAHNSK